MSYAASRRQPEIGWFTIFSATLAANILAGVLLLIGIRAYVYWSIQDTIDKVKNPPAQKAK